MRHAAKTYGAIAAQTANPRELEADLLLNAAARLQAIHDGYEVYVVEDCCGGSPEICAPLALIAERAAACCPQP